MLNRKKRTQDNPRVAVSKVLNDWHAANKAAQKMPVKFNVYIEELIKADRDRRLVAAPTVPPPPVRGGGTGGAAEASEE